MDLISDKFSKLGVDNAPGQEVRQTAVEFQLSGDVNAFEPVPGTLDEIIQGVNLGGEQA